MKKILVALDTSPVAPQVLKQGVELARAFGAELTLLRAVGLPTELPPEALSMSPDEVTTLLQRLAEKDLERLTAEVPAGVSYTREARVGVPWRVICEAANERGVDLIVIGAHGHKALDRVLGTTTNRVVTHTERSTLIVRS